MCKQDLNSPWGESLSLFGPLAERPEAATSFPQPQRPSQTRLPLAEFRLVEFQIAMIAAEKRAPRKSFRSTGFYDNA